MRREEITKQMRWSLAEELRRENLAAAEQGAEPVCFRETFYTRFGKRLLDIAVALPALLICLPVNLLLLALTYLDVGSPVFFRQLRSGKDGKPFAILKFRNMTNETDEHGELLPPAKRITRFGYFVRRTSLDELLNFWSVLKGDMSIIGPRPLVCEYEERYSARHRMRLCVRPGLECPPRGDSPIRSWQEQFENDVWYVEHVSLLTDIAMLFRLVLFAVNPQQVKHRAGVQRAAFMGYDETGKALDFYDIPVERFEAYD